MKHTLITAMTSLVLLFPAISSAQYQPTNNPSQRTVVHSQPEFKPLSAISLVPSLGGGVIWEGVSDTESWEGIEFYLGFKSIPFPNWVAFFFGGGIAIDFLQNEQTGQDVIDFIPTGKVGFTFLAGPDFDDTTARLLPIGSFYAIAGYRNPNVHRPSAIRLGVGASFPIFAIISLYIMGEGGPFIPNTLEAYLQQEPSTGKTSGVLSLTLSI